MSKSYRLWTIDIILCLRDYNIFISLDSLDGDLSPLLEQSSIVYLGGRQRPYSLRHGAIALCYVYYTLIGVASGAVIWTFVSLYIRLVNSSALHNLLTSIISLFVFLKGTLG